MTTSDEAETMRACLPEALRGEPIARVSAGLSGAGVYKVGDAHVLKVSPDGDFAQKVAILRAAAAAGVAPEVVHVDAKRHAVVSRFIQDRGFFQLLGRDREDALAMLAGALRRIQAIDVPAPRADPRAFLAKMIAATADLAMPAVARATAETVLALEAPPASYALAHCDANPTNFVWDGQRIVFLDWDLAAINSTTYDAAAICVFLRLADPGPMCDPTPRFRYDKRMIAAMCGMIFMHLARTQGHAGGDGAHTLAEVHGAMRAGELSVATADGKWRMGVALLGEAA